MSGLKPLEHQVAGHPASVLTSPGGDYIVKPSLPLEIEFYESTAPAHFVELVRGGYIAKFFGTESHDKPPKEGKVKIEQVRVRGRRPGWDVAVDSCERTRERWLIVHLAVQRHRHTHTRPHTRPHPGHQAREPHLWIPAPQRHRHQARNSTLRPLRPQPHTGQASSNGERVCQDDLWIGRNPVDWVHCKPSERDKEREGSTSVSRRRPTDGHGRGTFGLKTPVHIVAGLRRFEKFLRLDPQGVRQGDPLIRTVRWHPPLLPRRRGGSEFTPTARSDPVSTCWAASTHPSSRPRRRLERRRCSLLYRPKLRVASGRRESSHSLRRRPCRFRKRNGDEIRGQDD